MSDKPIPINTSGVPAGFVAPTPQNTPLTTAPIAQGLSKPTVPDIEEDNEGSEGETDDGAAGELTAEELNATMLGMVQGKLAGLIGKSSGYIETLPLPVRKRIEGLKGVHTKYAKLEAEYKREVLDLDRKVRVDSTPQRVAGLMMMPRCDCSTPHSTDLFLTADTLSCLVMLSQQRRRLRLVSKRLR